MIEKYSIDMRTGEWIGLIEHLRQSISIILTTRVGTRLERREFGSIVPDLIDYPASPKSILLLFGGVVTAIAKHEPRIKVHNISAVFSNTDNPNITIQLDASLIDSNVSNLNLEVQL